MFHTGRLGAREGLSGRSLLCDGKWVNTRQIATYQPNLGPRHSWIHPLMAMTSPLLSPQSANHRHEECMLSTLWAANCTVRIGLSWKMPPICIWLEKNWMSGHWAHSKAFLTIFFKKWRVHSESHRISREFTKAACLWAVCPWAGRGHKALVVYYELAPKKNVATQGHQANQNRMLGY